MSARTGTWRYTALGLPRLRPAYLCLQLVAQRQPFPPFSAARVDPRLLFFFPPHILSLSAPPRKPPLHPDPVDANLGPPPATDTIDLQDRSQPSAKDHSASQLRDEDEPAVGRHQAETLRDVAYEAADENTRKPPAGAHSRLYSDDDDNNSSDDGGDDSDSDSDFGDGVDGGARDGSPHEKASMNQQDALAIAQNGGAHDDDSDLDMDGDDLDDDMTGGISSSPSIEDGMCPSTFPPSPATCSVASKARTSALATSSTVTAHIPMSGGEADPTDMTLQPNVTPSHHHHHHRDVPAGKGPIEGQGPKYRAPVEDSAPAMLALAPIDSEHETPENADTTMVRSAHGFLRSRKELEKGEHGDAVGEHDPDLLVPYQPGDASDDDDGSDLSLPDTPDYVDSG